MAVMVFECEIRDKSGEGHGGSSCPRQRARVVVKGEINTIAVVGREMQPPVRGGVGCANRLELYSSWSKCLSSLDHRPELLWIPTDVWTITSMCS